MTLRDILENSTFIKATLAIWLVSLVFVLILLNRIDGIIHGDLYHYGLQFNLDWASNYWAFMRLIYFFLALPSALTIATLVSGLLRRGSRSSLNSVRETKPSNRRVQDLKENNMVIGCPKCKKMFSKPVVMLDFSSGKSKLVNVCPYCNSVLGNDKEDKNIETTVDLDREIIH